MVTLLKSFFIIIFALATDRIDEAVMEADAQLMDIEMELDELRPADDEPLELIPVEEGK